MKIMRLGRWSVCALGAVLILGCGQGDEREPLYQVTGTVTQGEEPVEGANVTFSPAGGGKPAVGVTDDSGKYTLGTYGTGDGAQTGQYKVTITKYEGEGGEVDQSAIEAAKAADELDPTDPNFDEYGENYDEATAQGVEAPKNVLPTKFADPSRSGLQAEVTSSEEDNVFDFKVD